MKLYKRSLTDLLFERNDVLFEMAAADGSLSAKKGYYAELVIGQELIRLYFGPKPTDAQKNIFVKHKKGTQKVSVAYTNYRKDETLIPHLLAIDTEATAQAKDFYDYFVKEYGTKKPTKIIWYGPVDPEFAQEDLIVEFSKEEKVWISAKAGKSEATQAAPGSKKIINSLGGTFALGDDDDNKKASVWIRDLIDKKCPASSDGWKQLLASYNANQGLPYGGSAYKKISELVRQSATKANPRYHKWYTDLKPNDQKKYLPLKDVQEYSSKINLVMTTGISALTQALTPSTEHLTALLAPIMSVYYPALVKEKTVDGVKLEVFAPTTSQLNQINLADYITHSKGKVKVMSSGPQAPLVKFLKEYIKDSKKVKESLRVVLGTKVMKKVKKSDDTTTKVLTRTKTNALWYVTADGKEEIPLLTFGYSAGGTSDKPGSLGGKVKLISRSRANYGEYADAVVFNTKKEKETELEKTVSKDSGLDDVAKELSARMAQLLKKGQGKGQVSLLYNKLIGSGGGSGIRTQIQKAAAQTKKPATLHDVFVSLAKSFSGSNGLQKFIAMNKTPIDIIKNWRIGQGAWKKILANAKKYDPSTNSKIKNKGRGDQQLLWPLNTPSAKIALVKALIDHYYNLTSGQLTESFDENIGDLLTERQRRFWDWSLK